MSCFCGNKEEIFYSMIVCKIVLLVVVYLKYEVGNRKIMILIKFIIDFVG